MKPACKRCNGSGLEFDQKEFGADVRRRREAVGWTLRAAAKRIGISESYLSDLELGRRHWNADIIRKIDGILK